MNRRPATDDHDRRPTTGVRRPATGVRGRLLPRFVLRRAAVVFGVEINDAHEVGFLAEARPVWGFFNETDRGDLLREVGPVAFGSGGWWE